ncbi:hypothetical protein [Curtobacterium sp. MCSS17_016]|uniref:hypothetical protein n=1 Tax=Curtobacterium sp. MCSS17_016 TaxID=2175644 RepID=UPI0015E878BD|nr:hypothetical protein [Curtobacterium sp. MCSS17_016]
MQVQQSSEKQAAAIEAGLDIDTVQFATEGPFEAWEGDSTALVHVLWDARHKGLTLKDDAATIADMIVGSRFLAAARALAAAGTPTVPVMNTRAAGSTGAVEELVAVLEEARLSGGDLRGDGSAKTANIVRGSGWFAAIQQAALTR